MVNLKHFLLVLCILSSTFLSAQISPSQRSAIYGALASQNQESIQKQISRLLSEDQPDNRSFRGALLMKKAGVLQKNKEKLQAFKEGRDLLENVIAQHPQNPEYRFLRLMIQENAPPILKYKVNIEEDIQLLKASYKNMPRESLSALKNYSKQSALLQSFDF